MKNYCSQNYRDCFTCSLANYNRDCHNNPIDLNKTMMSISDCIDYLDTDLSMSPKSWLKEKYNL